MKTFAILERAELREIDPDKLLGYNIMEYAETKLGYKHPVIKREVYKSELRDALRVMGHKPFVARSVEEYKAAELKRHMPNALMSVIAHLPDPVRVVVGAVAICAACVLFLSIFSTELAGEELAKFRMGCGTVLAIFGTLAVLIMRSANIEVTWKMREIENYRGPIPEFALATAMELHQRVPEAQFMIDELIVRRIPKDPFLVVTLGDEMYWLEVWEEPGYKQVRMA